ncbi:hypothetical protein N7478_004503 [Penicillium angulare]|uniref:uncharacterized protein n=1 Tax=Penicillium angulare TaxID=116970 RepID=UPI0025419697|nr:uncharacterized protein N7478_004503 [Penicillium angulare]KAJ5279131.1 hypothetical protein N7478_004503 [Penicillium angulare]
MAPTKGDAPLKASKVTKAQSPPKTAGSRKFTTVVSEDNMRILWAYLEKAQLQGATIDHKAVAKRMGLTYAATNQRYYTMRDYFKQLTPFDRPLENDETPAESKIAKSPRKKAVKSPKATEKSKAKKPATAVNDEEAADKFDYMNEDAAMALDEQVQQDIAKAEQTEA